VFGDQRLVAAIAAQVTFSAHIIETGTESCRLRTSGLGGRTQPRLECHAIAMMATIALAPARRRLAAGVVAQVSPVVTHRGSQCAHKQP
jgi:hypothetical protein